VVKYWDMDRWEMLLELPGHHGEVWALALSQYGDMVLTGGRACVCVCVRGI
jgi:U3 small nucleolar RNA-associated protein 12